MSTLKTISIVGSTGSIGRSTLRVVEQYPDRLKVVALAAGRDAAGLASQTARFRPEAVALADEKTAGRLRESLGSSPVQILTGPEGIDAVAAWPSADLTVIASVGFAGVRPTLAAINAGKQIALANKEALVAAGGVIMPLAEKRGVSIAPIDSEHSAIWQCLRAGSAHEVSRLILTASGGPFRLRPWETFDAITPAEALAHPTWRMGPRITIDSATMMNKGFEIIEAAWLFGVEPDRVDVVIHPQSIVHSMVEFRDGSIIAQLGKPDMMLPIAHALFHPERVAAPVESVRFDPTKSGALEFSTPEPERYPALALARRAYRMGPTGGAVLNAADEVAVAAFLDGRIRFPQIVRLVESVLNKHDVVSHPTIDDIESVDRWARGRAGALVAEVTARRMTVG